MKRLIALLFISLLTAHALADKPPVYTATFSNLGAGGYDVVAYFTQNQPVEGQSQYSLAYNGADWRFASRENLERFRQEPERYLPAYGGYCAWAVSQGYLAKGDPEQWTISDGRLFLNFNEAVKRKWLASKASLIRQADQNWPGVLEEG